MAATSYLLNFRASRRSARRCRLSRSPGIWLRRAHCHTDERYRADRQPTSHDHPVDLLLSLLAQSFRLATAFGAAFSACASEPVVASELARNRLAERLLETEESAGAMLRVSCTMIIGQTITATAPRAGIVQRLAADNGGVKQSG